MAYLITGVVLLIYLVLAFFIPNLMGLKGADAWILRGGLAVLGLAGAGAFLWWYRQQRKVQTGAATDTDTTSAGNDEISALVREAEQRLAAAKLEGGAGIGNLPLIFLLGDAGATKTSTMVHSGLEPELLAGQVYQNSNVVPTRVANVWFARRAIFAEAGAKLLGDAAAWTQFVRRLRPGKLASVVGKGEQAPRAALVCFDCENFTRAGASEAVTAAARNLHARLSAISQTLGISFPVYVLFTKTDRLPFFADFVRNLSNDEATQVVGATLPLQPAGASGVYAEEASARLSAAFDGIFRSLCDARIEFLPRENDGAKLPGAYEFPREFRKVRGSAVQFLVDLCRPSQLAASPFLRGFYFSGVRPVVVNDAAPVAAPPRPERQSMEAASGATGIFHVGQSAQQAPQPVAPLVTGGRKVPQWLFLTHLFNDVLLPDRAAMGASSSSTQTNFLRRVLLASAAALCLILSVCFVVSYFGNRGLEGRVLEAARGISSAESSGFNLASLDSLKRLETLRQTLETLTTYEREGAPLRLRWGLYSGGKIYPEVRRLYFSRFHQLLFGQTQAQLLGSLQRLPATPGPGDSYGTAYDTLKAYLITTSHHDKSTRMFLTPVLLDRWMAGRGVDPERAQLAQKQFDFYAAELKVENPFSSENDGLAVERGRRYLAQFAGMERVYQNMLAEAAKTNPSINFNRRFPGSAEVVVDTREVAGAFTKGGWDFMKNAIRNADKYFSGEQWVLGDQGVSNVDRAKLEQQLRERYNADFLGQWRAYLKGASVVRYGGLQDAARKLNILSGNQSPLLALFWLASQNTNVDDPKITSALQPVHAVVPPSSVDRYIAPPNQGYMNALVSLQTSLEQIAGQPGPVNEAAAGQTLANASTAKSTTRQVAQGFRPDPEGRVDAAVQKLMEDPITYVEGLLRTLGPAELNGKAKALCGQFRPLLTKYPFNPSATAQATVQEVNAIFRKPDGALWAFYEASLQKALMRQGSQYVPNPSSGVKLNPAFVGFFNQAAAFSEALYAGGTQDPHLTYSLKPVPSEGIQTVTLTLDGQNLKYSGGSAGVKQFTWQGAGNHEAKATVKFGGGPDLAWSNNDGLWAVFHFFGKAERWTPAGSGHSLEWVIRIGRDAVTLPNGNPLTVRFELDMGAAPPVFQKGYLARLSCVSEAAR